MNQRIKELLNVCGMPNEDLMEIYSDPNKSFYIQQFAELIINECIEVLESRYTSDKELEGYGEVVYLLQQSIEEHFGVE